MDSEQTKETDKPQHVQDEQELRQCEILIRSRDAKIKMLEANAMAIGKPEGGQGIKESEELTMLRQAFVKARNEMEHYKRQNSQMSLEGIRRQTESGDEISRLTKTVEELNPSVVDKDQRVSAANSLAKANKKLAEEVNWEVTKCNQKYNSSPGIVVACPLRGSVKDFAP